MKPEHKTDDQDIEKDSTTSKESRLLDESPSVRLLRMHRAARARLTRVLTLAEIEAEERARRESGHSTVPIEPEYSNRRFGEWGDLSSDEAFSPLSFGIKQRKPDTENSPEDPEPEAA